jgi:hypothetical protein
MTGVAGPSETFLERVRSVRGRPQHLSNLLQPAAPLPLSLVWNKIFLPFKTFKNDCLKGGTRNTEVTRNLGQFLVSVVEWRKDLTLCFINPVNQSDLYAPKP